MALFTPKVTWHKYSILIRSEFFASPPVEQKKSKLPNGITVFPN